MTKWRVPDDIYGDRPYRIDPLMQAMSGETRFAAKLSQSQMVQLGRRTLEVAIGRAIGDEVNLTAAREDWQSVARLARSASSQLSALIKNLAPPQKHPHWDEGQALSMPLRNMMAGNPTEAAGADAFETERRAKEQAVNLLKARATLELIAKNAKAKDSFVASLNKNAGARDQNEFVKTFAETWIALSGALPPTSTKMSPFLKLLYAAWQDANQDKGANFRRAILRARSDVKPFVPTLIQAGPDWL